MKDKKSKKDKSVRRGARKVVVDDSTYFWKVGGPGVVVWNTEGVRHLAGIKDVTGLLPSVFERGQYKRTNDGMILPSMVANWIRVHLQGKPPIDEPVTRVEINVPVVQHEVPPQPQIYVVVGEAGEYDDHSMWIVEASLDPQVALDAANALNDFERNHCDSLHAEMEAFLDNQGIPQSFFRYASPEAIALYDRFLDQQGIRHPEARRIAMRRRGGGDYKRKYSSISVRLTAEVKPIASCELVTS